MTELTTKQKLIFVTSIIGISVLGGVVTTCAPGVGFWVGMLSGAYATHLGYWRANL